MLHKTKAIVLHTLKYSESGIIVHAYTDIFGRQAYLVQGVRKIKSRINSNFFQPLSLLELDVYFKENRDLQRIKEASFFPSTSHLHFDIRRSAIAMFLSEFLYKSLREIEPNQKLFDFLFHSVQILEMTDNGLENFHLIFLMQFTKFIGIYPGDDPNIHSFHKKQTLNFLDLLKYSLADTAKLKLSNSSRSEILNQLVVYYKTHLEDIGHLNSLKILEEVFH